MKKVLLVKSDYKVYLQRESGEFLFCPLSSINCSSSCPFLSYDEGNGTVELNCLNKTSFTIKEVINQKTNDESPQRTLDQIAIYVSNYFKIIPETLKTKIKESNLCIIRHCFTYLAIVKEGHSMKEVANYLNREHSTILSSIRFVQNMLETNDISLKKYIEFIKNYRA